MKIGPTNRPDITPERVQKKQPEFQNRQLNELKKDTVEISQSGREKLKELADHYQKKIGNDNEIIEQISPKAARIRNKVEAGYYNLEDIESKIIEKLADTITNEINNNKKME